MSEAHESKYARKQRLARENADRGLCPHGVNLTKRCYVCQPDEPANRFNPVIAVPVRPNPVVLHDEIEHLERTKTRGGLYGRGRRNPKE